MNKKILSGHPIAIINGMILSSNEISGDEARAVINKFLLEYDKLIMHHKGVAKDVINNFETEIKKRDITPDIGKITINVFKKVFPLVAPTGIYTEIFIAGYDIYKIINSEIERQIKIGVANTLSDYIIEQRRVISELVMDPKLEYKIFDKWSTIDDINRGKMFIDYLRLDATSYMKDQIHKITHDKLMLDLTCGLIQNIKNNYPGNYSSGLPILYGVIDITMKRGGEIKKFEIGLPDTFSEYGENIKNILIKHSNHKDDKININTFPCYKYLKIKEGLRAFKIPCQPHLVT